MKKLLLGLLIVFDLGSGLVFVSISITNYNFLLNSKLIEAAITNKTKAIMPVHIYGRVCAMEKISQIAKKYNLKIIEDSVQAHGVNEATTQRK